jgi:hypothetical protein
MGFVTATFMLFLVCSHCSEHHYCTIYMCAGAGAGDAFLFFEFQCGKLQEAVLLALA